MSDVGSFFSHILTVMTPPFWQIRRNEIPNSIKIIMSAMQARSPNSRLARQLLYLCRVTGVLWVIWACNMLIVFVGGVILLKISGDWANWSQVTFINLTYKQVIPVLGACLFVGGLVRSFFAMISLVLAENCRDYLKESISASRSAK